MGMNTGQRAGAGLVEQYIGSAYDNVKKVADDIEAIVSLAQVVDAQTDFNAMANVVTTLGTSVSDLAALATADLVAISDDLNKGNYVGNRKVDINLALNNTSTDTEVTYQGATITTNDGVVLQINFETLDGNGEPVIQELSSYTAIYNEIVAGITAYNTGEADTSLHIVNHEIDIINSTLPNLPTMIRIRDTDGSASNIDRIQLQVFSGSAVETAPTYFWAKTTSALQTLANRVGDVIALGNDIDSIIALAAQTDELGYLYADRAKLTGAANSLYSELSKLQTLHTNILSIITVANDITSVATTAANIADVNYVANNITEIQNAEANAILAQTKAGEASASALAASGSATTAVDAAGTATNKSDEIKAVTVGSTTTGVAGTNALVTYNSATGQFAFVVPQGVKGDKGEAFQVNAVGLLTSKSLYDTRIAGFSFLATDTATIYFKLSDTSGDWSAGAPFGKGDKGDTGNTGNGIVSTIFASTTDISGLPAQSGATDTYTITYTDTTTDTFTIYNGVDVTINDSGTSTTEVWSSSKINTKLGGKAASSHTHTKAEAGLANVDNTSDVNKPISTAAQAALDAINNELDTTFPALVAGDENKTLSVKADLSGYEVKAPSGGVSIATLMAYGAI